MKKLWVVFLAFLVSVSVCSWAYGESNDEKFLDIMSKVLRLNNPLPEDCSGAVALYQSLVTCSAIIPDDDDNSLLERIIACDVIPAYHSRDGERLDIVFSDQYRVVLQGMPFQLAHIQLLCGETEIDIPITTVYTVANTPSTKKDLTTYNEGYVVPSIGSEQTYHDLEAIYTAEHPIPDSAINGYASIMAASYEFIQIAKLVAFLYPGMHWDEFVMITDAMGITDQAVYEEDTWTWTIDPPPAAQIILQAKWEQNQLQHINIQLDPYFGPTPSGETVFELADSGEMVWIYVPCVYIDLQHTWLSERVNTDAMNP